jgi:hypothetical protein
MEAPIIVRLMKLLEAGILKEITYPTGLKVKYSYEHNRGQNSIYGNNYLKSNYFDTLSYIETVKIFKTHLDTNVDGNDYNQIFGKNLLYPKIVLVIINLIFYSLIMIFS